MCGRYQFTAEQSEEILQIIQEVQNKFGAEAAKAVSPAIKNSPYAISRRVKALQRLFDKHILRDWDQEAISEL